MVFGSHFIFDGADSRDYNLFLCSFDGAQDEDLSMGLGIEAITMELRDNTIDYGGKYNEVLTFQFSACLDDRQENQAFDRYQVREIVNWLSSKELKWLSFYDEDDMEYWYFCRFTNIETKKLCGRVIGFNFEVTCDSPYAYSDIKTVKLDELAIQKPSGEQMLTGITRIRNIYTDTDVPICPNIFIEHQGLSALTKELNLLVSNTQNNSGFEVGNFPVKGSISGGTGHSLVMIDLNNWLLCGCNKENRKFQADYQVIYEKSPVYGHSAAPDTKLLELEKGDNEIHLELKILDGLTAEDSLTNASFTVYLQYREKYKAGVF
ncbi:MAG: hypothetical protein HFI75_06240 [Lachnospiraceae bacterium]|nr:hypothetical protein [Lachnospiraceae bacterium]